ncbi:MAG: Flp pilus assembly complex ATPase component TadA [Actinomycetota bacterium]|nr:Flp pilus assembly complex ATPase component TadA [Actinomycetota bacterium]
MAAAYDQLRTTVLGILETRVLDSGDLDGLVALIDDQIDKYQRTADPGFGTEPLTDPEAVRERLVRSIRGSGPLAAALANRRVREISGDDDDLTCRMSDGTLQPIDEPTSADEVYEVIQRIVTDAGAEINETHPGVNGLRVKLPSGRLGRLSASVAPRIDGKISFVLRIPEQRNMVLKDWVDLGSITQPAANLLHVVARTRTSMAIAGPPGAGKTSLLSAMIRASGDIRTILLEENREISAPIIDGAKWATSTAESMYDLVVSTKTASPELVIEGEFQGDEAWELTKVANIGASLWCAIHSKSASEAINAVAFAAKGAPEAAGMSVFELLQRFATLLDVVVYVDREDNDSARYYRRKPLQRVTEISVHSAQPSALGVTLQPIFIRDDLESPLRWTEVELPEVLQRRFDLVLRRHGLRTIDLLQGAAIQF